MTKTKKGLFFTAGILLATVFMFSCSSDGGLESLLGGSAPAIATATLPGGTVGAAYSQPLVASGSAPTWGLQSGALPPGLSIMSNGVISGIPTTAGTFIFIVNATNASGSDMKELSITIVNAGDPNPNPNPNPSVSSSSVGGGSSPSGGSSSSLGGQSSSSSLQGNGFTYGSFTDVRDSKIYKTIEIGTQTWLAENLNFQEEQIGPTRGSKCYDDKESNCAKYGRLYEWDDALEVCPSGWHLPTVPEWNTLISFVGTTPGKKLKATDDVWRDNSGTDDYGFAALPGGRFADEFGNININGTWWTATEQNADRGYYKIMEETNNNVSQDYANKTVQRSVRCVLGPSSSSSITYVETQDPRDGKKYHIVHIGTQNWMVENLNFETGGVCYDNKESNCDKYGRLYDWETAKTVCPSGWKLPTVSEWNALTSFVDAPAGKNLKAKTSDWGDGYGRDNYGFAALPGGSFGTEFANININGVWWTATEQNASRAYYKIMRKTDNNVSQDYYNKNAQFSVRCVEE